MTASDTETKTALKPTKLVLPENGVYRGLRTRLVTVPGGWRFTDPDTGYQFRAPDFDTLLHQIRGHRLYKKLPVDDLARLVDHFICQNLTSRWWYELEIQRDG